MIFFEYLDFYISNLFRRRRIKNLEDLRCFLQTIPKLNSGGCGISALVMFRWIKENCEDDVIGSVSIIFGYDNSNTDGYEKNENARKNNSNGLIAPTHALLSDDIKYWDSHDAWYNISYTYKHSLSEELLVRAINEGKYWNKEFKRKFYLSQIKRIVNVDLSDIK